MGTSTKATRFRGPTVVTLRGAGSLGHDAQTVGDGSDVGLDVQVPAAQTANSLQITKPDGTVVYAVGPNGVVTMAGGVALASAPNAAGVGPLMCAHAIYNFAVDGGAISLITPAANAVIPANAIVVGGMINPTTAPVGASATISIGTSAGSSATSIKAATAITAFTIDALVAVVPLMTAATAFKMSAAGSITLTVAVAALTAGVIEIFVYYLQPLNA